MQYVTFWCYVFWSVQAIVFGSYSSSCMVYKAVRYLFIDIFNANIRTIYICYHKLVVRFQCCSVGSHFILYYVYRIMCL